MTVVVNISYPCSSLLLPVKVRKQGQCNVYRPTQLHPPPPPEEEVSFGVLTQAPSGSRLAQQGTLNATTSSSSYGALVAWTTRQPSLRITCS